MTGDSRRAHPDDGMQRITTRVACGDHAAFEKLYFSLAPGLRSFLSRLGWSSGEAEEGCQEVFLRLWRSRKKLQHGSSPARLLYRMARNLWADGQRVRCLHGTWKKQQIQAGPAILEDSGDDPARALRVEEEYRLVREAIDRLPETHRMVILLKNLHGMKGEEIARALNIPPGTVASRLHNAILQVRQMLETRGDETRSRR